MTPQEQYRKFYDKPHLWTGAIEVECTKSWQREFLQGEAGEKLPVNEILCIRNRQLDLWDKYIPKFKPQEGQQFLKDLEEAVSAGCYGEVVTKTLDTKYDWTFTLKDDDEASITVVKAGLDISLSRGVTFNAAAYTDKLRQLGYYV